MFEDGLTPRWLASKRHGWNTTGWESEESKLAVVDSKEARLSKEQQDITLELGFRKDDRRSAEERMVNTRVAETTPQATRLEDTRRGWASHRHSVSSRAHRQQDDSLLAEAFSAHGYAVIADTLSNEEAVCLRNFYQSRKQTNE